jgi:predicted RecA/RadA family phage recombinase
MQNYVQEGDVLTLTAPSGGVVSGTTYKIGALVVVAQVSAAEGESFSAVAEGVCTLTKTTSQAWTEGQRLYWDDSGKKWTTTAQGNTYGGVAAAAAQSADTSGNVRLTGSSPEVGVQAASIAALGTTSNLVGVDGTGSNAAPLAGTEARLDAIEAKVDAIIAALDTYGVTA